MRAHLAGAREAGVRRGAGVDPFDEFEADVRCRLGDGPHVRATVLFGEVAALGPPASAGNERQFQGSRPPALVLRLAATTCGCAARNISPSCCAG